VPLTFLSAVDIFVCRWHFCLPLTFLSAADIFVCRWHFCLPWTFCNLWTSLWLECCLTHFYELFRETKLISALPWAFLPAVDIFVCRWHFVTYELPCY
jgi:hypothetical protein